MPYVVIVGNMHEAVGPFEDRAGAQTFADTYLHSGWGTTVTTLNPPRPSTYRVSLDIEFLDKDGNTTPEGAFGEDFVVSAWSEKQAEGFACRAATEKYKDQADSGRVPYGMTLEVVRTLRRA